MRKEELLELIGEVDARYVEQSFAPRRENRLRRHVMVLAASLCLVLLGGFGVGQMMERAPEPIESGQKVNVRELLALPEGQMSEAALIYRVLPLEDRAAEYHKRELSAAGREQLRGALGEELAGATGYYRLAGDDTLRYLISSEEGEIALWEFSAFLVWDEGENVTGADWFREGMDGSPYSYGQVLELIYGIHRVEEIMSIRVSAANMDHTDAGKMLQRESGERVIDDRGEIGTIYDIVAKMRCLGGDHWEWIGVGENTLEAVKKSRYLTIVTQAGEEIESLKYTALSDRFYEYGGIAYEELSPAQAAEVARIFGI